jgi:hypothetical protein
MSYRDPTESDLKDSLFDKIWEAIKSWDINVPGEYGGYCGATGNHVCAILDAVRSDDVDKAFKFLEMPPVPEEAFQFIEMARKANEKEISK